jgi:hypothetical protein
LVGAKALFKLTGTPLTDTQSGCRLIRAEVLRVMRGNWSS